MREYCVDFQEYSTRDKEEKHQSCKKHDVYDEMYSDIQHYKIAKKIGLAESNNQHYIILFNVNFNLSDGHVTNRKDLVYNFDPYEKGTIYNILNDSLLDNYKIFVDECESYTSYTFRLYLSPNELTVWDKISLWIDSFNEI